MKNTSAEKLREKTFRLPYLMGVFLALNAVKDACAVVDGSNCVMAKADMIAGNHDLFSTLFSSSGRHRIVCTMSIPVNQPKNPEKKITAMLNSVAGEGGFAALILTALPFGRLAGMDYERLARAAGGKVPVTHVAPLSLQADWLEGYDLALEALARIMPPARGRRARNKVAVVGLMMDRNERDHTANLKEISRLLGEAGLELVSTWPSGGGIAELARAAEASLVVSLPYGRRAAAALAARYGSKLLETGLPLGLKGTSAWLSAVRAAAGLSGPLPAPLLKEERAAASFIVPALRRLQHARVMFAGDPHLYQAFLSLAAEFCMKVPLAFLDSDRKPLGPVPRGTTVLFSPTTEEALEAAKKLGFYEQPGLAVANSFALTECLHRGVPSVELGFPSFGHHCLYDEPFLGYAGARVLAARLLNALQS